MNVGMEQNRLYTNHGKKRSHGIAFRTPKGVPALGFYEGDSIVGFSTLEEINREFYTGNLPILDVEEKGAHKT